MSSLQLHPKNRLQEAQWEWEHGDMGYALVLRLEEAIEERLKVQIMPSNTTGYQRLLQGDGNDDAQPLPNPDALVPQFQIKNKPFTMSLPHKTFNKFPADDVDVYEQQYLMYQSFQRYLNGKYREVFTLSKDIHYLNETLFRKIFRTGDQQPINVLIQLASFFNKRIPRLLHVPFMRSYARCRGKLYMWFWVNQLEILDYLKESPIEGSWRMVRFRKYDSSKVGLYKGQKIVD